MIPAIEGRLFRHLHGKNAVNATRSGVGMLICSWVPKSINSTEKIQPRMMVATFNGNPSTPKHNALVIIGNMNVQKGKNVNNKSS